MCHCLECQRRTGSVFGAQARFPIDQAKIEGRATLYSRRGDSGGVATFRFCPDCGTTLYWTFDKMPDVLAISIGTFADPSFPAPTVSVYGVRRHAWVSLPEGAEDME